jgi:hypothetical protein
VALSLGGCGDDQFPDYRYRMTVYVGDKPFSSVRAVLQEQVFSVADSSGQAVKRSLKGEAVIIEANSRTYYALLGKPDEPEYGQKVANYALLPLVPEFRRNPETDMLAVERGTESLDRMAATQRAMVKIAGPVDLPRTRPNPFPGRNPRELDAWPLFVTFDDPRNPRTVREVSPDNVGVSRITIEITGDDPSAGIERNLPWLPNYSDRNFSGNRFQSLDDIKSNGLSASITSGLFSTGTDSRRDRH